MTRDVLLAPADNVRLVELCGPLDETPASDRGAARRGDPPARQPIPDPRAAGGRERAEAVLQELYARAQREPVDSERVHIALQELDMDGER